MFKSKRRPIVTPQSEHLKLVGTLSMLWGNDDFDSPPIERTSMIAGMGLHDRGYGYLDNHPIGGMDDSKWFEIARRGFYMPCSDVIADTITKYHVRRLADDGDSVERKALTAEFSQALDEQLDQYNLSKELFSRVDRITDLCDRLSFRLCFDVPASGEVLVFPRIGEERQVAIAYRVEDGLINVSPWPFSVDVYEGYLVAYKLEGYPEQLDPVILPYTLKRK
jgi:Protein of unknown function (DUF3891)